MKRFRKFALRVNQQELDAINRLSKLLRRSKSDAIRYVIEDALRRDEKIFPDSEESKIS